MRGSLDAFLIACVQCCFLASTMDRFAVLHAIRYLTRSVSCLVDFHRLSNRLLFCFAATASGVNQLLSLFALRLVDVQRGTSSSRIFVISASSCATNWSAVVAGCTEIEDYQFFTECCHIQPFPVSEGRFSDDSRFYFSYNGASHEIMIGYSHSSNGHVLNEAGVS